MITIIILLILAGITIAQLSNNGLFDRTRVAKEKYINSKEKEETDIEATTNTIDEIVGNRNISEDRIREIIREELNNQNRFKSILDKTASNYSTTESGIIINVNSSWTNKNIDVSLSESMQNFDLLLITVDLNNRSSYKNLYH